LLHLLTEWLHAGRPLHRPLLGLLLSLICLSLISGVWLQPKLNQLHRTIYAVGPKAAPAQVEEAQASFRHWHRLAQVIHWMMLAGSLGYLWRLSQPIPASRFVTRAKYHLE